VGFLFNFATKIAAWRRFGSFSAKEKID